MVVGWTDLGVVLDYVNQYYTGSMVVTAVIFLVMFLMILSSAGVNLGLAFMFSLPLVAGLAVGGWFGVATWVLSLALLVGGMVYAVAIIKLFA